jgi:hypothetical protein
LPRSITTSPGSRPRPSLLSHAPFFGTSFFDAEDDYHVKTDLWRAANIGLCVLDLLYGVNRDFGVLTFAGDYVSRLQELIRQHEALGEEVRATERFQTTQRKIGEAQG